MTETSPRDSQLCELFKQSAVDLTCLVMFRIARQAAMLY